MQRIQGFLLVESLVCLGILLTAILFFYQVAIDELRTKERFEDEVKIEEMLRLQCIHPQRSYHVSLYHGSTDTHYERTKDRAIVWAEYNGRRYQHEVKK